MVPWPGLKFKTSHYGEYLRRGYRIMQKYVYHQKAKNTGNTWKTLLIGSKFFETKLLEIADFFFFPNELIYNRVVRNHVIRGKASEFLETRALRGLNVNGHDYGKNKLWGYQLEISQFVFLSSALEFCSI